MNLSKIHLTTLIAFSYRVCLLFLLPQAVTATPPVVLAVPANEEGLARFRQWTPLAEYFADASGLRVKLEIVEDHPAVVRGMEKKLYDLAFVDPAWYVFLSDRKLCLPLARPIVAGRDTFRSALIVHRDSILRSADDLSGSRIALTVPHESAGGYYIPLALLETNNLSTSDPEKLLYSDTFLSILKGVAYGKLEAGFVSSSVLDDRRNASLREQVRVVLESEAVPQWTVVARGDLRRETAALIQKWLLAATSTEQGRSALALAGFSAFIEARDPDYNIVRRYLETVEDRVVPPE